MVVGGGGGRHKEPWEKQTIRNYNLCSQSPEEEKEDITEKELSKQ